MLGSAIPRRWIFSLALVGLVSIFAVSYAAVWSSTAIANSQGTGGGTGIGGAPLADGLTIDDNPASNTLPSGLSMQSGQQLLISIQLHDKTGAPNNALPNLTFNWTSSGSVSIIGSTTGSSVTVQANSSGTGTVQATVTQDQSTSNFVVVRDMTITVLSPGAAATASAPPTNPGSPPLSIPNSTGVVTPEGTLLVSSTGLESGGNPENQALGNRPVIFIQSGSVNGFFGVNVNSVDPATLPAMPARFIRGSSATDISFVDELGTVQNNFRLLRSAKVCLPTASGDLANGFSNIRVLRFNSSVGQWVELTSTYNTITRQVCANSSNFSNFAVGVLQVQVQATQGPIGNLPATGGWSPGSGLLLFAGLFGFVLVGGGVVSMRRARNARPE